VALNILIDTLFHYAYTISEQREVLSMSIEIKEYEGFKPEVKEDKKATKKKSNKDKKTTK
jgi:hypothetical protein